MAKDTQSHPCRIRVGTSGYAYAEWTAAGFYPPGTPSGGMLAVYAQTFDVTELNYTWYQMPKAPAVGRMLAHAPEGFSFTAKLTRTLTHEIETDRWKSEVAAYRRGIAPLLQAGRLKAVLIQLPPTFVRSPGRRRYLAELLDTLSGLPLAVEFRHASWAVDRVFAELEKRRVTLVTVDTPALPGLFPTLDVVTHQALFYVRFHGRNQKGWRTGNMQKQFDYDYSEAELQEFAQGPIAQMARNAQNGLLFFNNHVRAQAPQNATRLTRCLASMGLVDHPAWNAPSSTSTSPTSP